MWNSYKSIIIFLGAFLIMVSMPSKTLSANALAEKVHPQSCFNKNNSTPTVLSDNIFTTASDDEDEYLVKTFGDMDGDNDIDVSDIMLVVQYLLTQDANISKQDADVNWDGEVSINDVTLLVSIALGNNPPTPVYVPLF